MDWDSISADDWRRMGYCWDDSLRLMWLCDGEDVTTYSPRDALSAELLERALSWAACPIW